MRLLSSIINNLNEKQYLKNKKYLKLYSDKSSNNEILLSNESKQMLKIKEYQEEVRHNNLKVYLKNILLLRTKQAAIIATPILIGGLSIASWNKEFSGSKDYNVYKKHVIEFDEEHIIKDEIEETDYVNAFFLRNLEHPAKNNTTYLKNSSEAHIYFGEGEKCEQGEFRIKHDGRWEYLSETDDAYFDLNDDVYLEEITPEYEFLINEATNLFINKSSISKDDEKLVRSFVENNKNDILVNIVKYEYIGKKDIKYSYNQTLIRVLIVIIDLIIVLLIRNRYIDLFDIFQLSSVNGSLKKTDNYIGLFHAALRMKEEFMTAEYQRILVLNELLEKHSGTKDILTKHEKKLLLDKKE